MDVRTCEQCKQGYAGKLGRCPFCGHLPGSALFVPKTIPKKVEPKVVLRKIESSKSVVKPQSRGIVEGKGAKVHSMDVRAKAKCLKCEYAFEVNEYEWPIKLKCSKCGSFSIKYTTPIIVLIKGETKEEKKFRALVNTGKALTEKAQELETQIDHLVRQCQLLHVLPLLIAELNDLRTRIVKNAWFERDRQLKKWGLMK